MMPLCLTGFLPTTAIVYLMAVLSTCSTRDCRFRMTEEMRVRSVIFRSIDVKLCQAECFQDGFIFASCHRSDDVSKRTNETGRFSVRPESHLSNDTMSNQCNQAEHFVVRCCFDTGTFVYMISSGACSHMYCQWNSRCEERRRGDAVCVEGHNISNTLEKRCVINSDCPEERMFVCFSLTCKCKEGYSFNPTNNSCVRRCKTYGDGFTSYRGLGIKEHNDAMKSHIKNSKECSEMCVKEKKFTCLTYDFHFVHKYCHLSKSGYLDVKLSYRETGERNWVLAVRNCA